MLYQDKSQTDFISSTAPVYYDWKSYGAFGADMFGTFTAGNLKIQGSSDGSSWDTLFTVKDGNQVTNNAINAAGHYIANIVSYQQGRILPSDDFIGSVRVAANIGVMPPQIVASVVGG